MPLQLIPSGTMDSGLGDRRPVSCVDRVGVVRKNGPRDRDKLNSRDTRLASDTTMDARSEREGV